MNSHDDTARWQSWLFMYFFWFLQLLGSLIKPVMKQASKRLSVGYIFMLPALPCSFYYGIYKGYNRRKSGLTPK